MDHPPGSRPAGAGAFERAADSLVGWMERAVGWTHRMAQRSLSTPAAYALRSFTSEDSTLPTIFSTFAIP